MTTTTHHYHDEASRLAANTRKARAALRALDRCGHPVLTADRAKAQAAIETAVAAEAAYWSTR